jgi:hypothetical protein
VILKEKFMWCHKNCTAECKCDRRRLLCEFLIVNKPP